MAASSWLNGKMTGLPLHPCDKQTKLAPERGGWNASACIDPSIMLLMTEGRHIEAILLFCIPASRSDCDLNQ